jgi:hypothetical protein
MKHFHTCICGERWPCMTNILPLPDGLGRVRCERWPESICSSCIDSIVAAQGRDMLKPMLAVVHALAAHEIGKRLNEC